MERLLQDIRFGLRTLTKNPGFTLIAVIALALGIGANSVIFSAINSVLLKPLPYKDSDKLVMIWHNYPDINLPQASLSPPSYIEYRDMTSSFEQVAAGASWSANLTGVGEPERIEGARLSYNFFTTLGVDPILGRTFIAEEDQPGKNRVVIISHGLWQRRFGSDPGIIGKQITLDGNVFDVVGVMPRGFEFFLEVDLWTPLALTSEQLAADNHGNEFLIGIARLKSNVTMQQAQAEMNTLAEQLRQQFYDGGNWGITLVDMQEQFTGQIRPALLILLAAVGCVLLIACANVANLLLARAASRQKEMAIRAALGANRSRVIRQLLTESVLLAALGGLTGLALAFVGIKVLVTSLPQDIAQFIAGWKTISLDTNVLLFTLALSLITGIFFGVIPAIQASRPDLNDTLKDAGKGTSSGSRSHRFLNTFVVVEVAIALVLLIGAGLLIRSFVTLQKVQPGFNSENVLTMQMSLPRTKYREAHQFNAFFDQVLQKVSGLAGVRSAGIVNNIPMGSNSQNASFFIEGMQIAPGQASPHGDPYMITPAYFETMGIPLLKGRFFNEQDNADSLPVVIIDETLAERYWPNEDPIGKRMAAYFDRKNGQPRLREVVGVVGHTKSYGLDGRSKVQYYFPYSQRSQQSVYLTVRTTSDPLSLVAAVRSAVSSVDSDQPLYNIKTMDEVLSNSMAPQRFSTWMLGIFAAIAMVLAATGIYGVMSYSVSQRTHEIGIRMALGASRGDVLKMVTGRGMVLTSIGVVIGLGAAFGVTQWMSSLLFGVTATDVVTFVSIPLILVIVALVACFIPARRATKIDPIQALRYE
jgi:putative ABC transport system permease protein